MIYISTLLIIFAIIICKYSFYIEKSQDLNLDKEFKTKEHFYYETCSICGKKLKHARFGKNGDIMRCTVECRGKTTWYCEKCAKEILDKEECVSPEEYLKQIGENNERDKIFTV